MSCFSSGSSARGLASYHVRAHHCGHRQITWDILAGIGYMDAQAPAAWTRRRRPHGRAGADSNDTQAPPAWTRRRRPHGRAGADRMDAQAPTAGAHLVEVQTLVRPAAHLGDEVVGDESRTEADTALELLASVKTVRVEHAFCSAVAHSQRVLAPDAHLCLRRASEREDLRNRTILQAHLPRLRLRCWRRPNLSEICGRRRRCRHGRWRVGHGGASLCG